jgi:hypothetical protein
MEEILGIVRVDKELILSFYVLIEGYSQRDDAVESLHAAMSEAAATLQIQAYCFKACAIPVVEDSATRVNFLVNI